MNDPKKPWTQRERPHSTWPCLELASFPLFLWIPISQNGRQDRMGFLNLAY